MILVIPWALYGALNLPVGSASVHKWLPDRFEERQLYERFLAEFGNDQFLVVTWDGCRVDDPRVDQFRTRLLKPEDDRWPLVAEVITTGDVMQSLVEPLRISPRQAAIRLKGFLIGADGTAAVVVRFTERGISRQKWSMRHVLAAADAVPSLGSEQLHMAGTVYEAYAVDEASESSLKRLVVPSCLLGMVLSWVCLRSIRAALAVLILAGVGQLLAIGLVYYTGGHFSAVLIVLPTLVFMLTLSGSVHLMSYYTDVAQWHTNHLGSRAMLLGFKPSVLASLTTSLGMAALATSQLAPVREFGLYSACALSMATAFMLLGFPKLADWFCGGGSSQRVEGDQSEELSLHQNLTDAAAHPAQVSPTAQRYVAWLERRAIVVTTAGMVLMAITFYGFLSLKSSTKFDDMFPSNSPVVQDMAWIEQHLGPISSVEVLLTFDNRLAMDELQQLDWVEKVVDSLRTNDYVGGVMSALTFLPERSKTSSLRDVIRRGAMRKMLDGNMVKLTERGWVAKTQQATIWRVTAKVSAVADEDYGILTNEVRSAVHAVQIAEVENSEVPFTAGFTGLSPVMHATQLILLRDLGASFSTAFMLITPVMMLIARGFWAGLLIMIPNVLPETLVFGTMSWLGFRLDVAGILTASVAMGIAVNDTLHFVNWYARRLSLGDTRVQAVADTLTSCASAMFYTMLISCCSMLPFMLAEFVPTRQFACLMIAMLSSALLGDLVLLPALLLSPLGLCLMPRRAQLPIPEK